jgi:hypothetical protein
MQRLMYWMKMLATVEAAASASAETESSEEEWVAVHNMHTLADRTASMKRTAWVERSSSQDYSN